MTYGILVCYRNILLTETAAGGYLFALPNGSRYGVPNHETAASIIDNYFDNYPPLYESDFQCIVPPVDPVDEPPEPLYYMGILLTPNIEYGGYFFTLPDGSKQGAYYETATRIIREYFYNIDTCPFVVGDHLRFIGQTGPNGVVYGTEAVVNGLHPNNYSIAIYSLNISMSVLYHNKDWVLYVPSDPVITYKDSCIGTILYRNKYVDGVYVGRTLIKINSPTCGYTPPDPCEGVVCDDVCRDYDLYSQYCASGSCVLGSRIATNSPTCGYTPPDPVITYDNTCTGTTLFRNKYVDGVHVDQTVLETNSPTCGYTPPDPCEGVVCDDVCRDYDLYSQYCAYGSCVLGSRIATNSPTCGYTPPDPCEGVVCDDECIGYDLYSHHCVDGSCVPGSRIATNSPTCGYTPPDDDYIDPDIDDDVEDDAEKDNALLYVALAAAAGAAAFALG